MGGAVAAVVGYFIFASPMIAELMPRRRKLDLEKILAALNFTCPHCRTAIPPDKRVRIDFEHLRCPKCGEIFIPEKRQA
jgi:predicted RNA-binding Zn-ribbon protein involved in translation (DUF1610 family)